jgi:hypothetical protein
MMTLKTEANKTARLTLLLTPEFKIFLAAEAKKDGVSVAELVRTRCEQRPDADELMLGELTTELRKSVREASTSLRSGLAEADGVLAELRAKRTALPTTKNVESRGRKVASGVHA